MKKVLKKRNNQLTSVEAWAVEYSAQRAKERRKEQSLGEELIEALNDVLEKERCLKKTSKTKTG